MASPISAANAYAKLARLALITLAIVVVMGSVGIDLSALALFSGAVGVGIGLSWQSGAHCRAPTAPPHFQSGSCRTIAAG